jgi:hypothetical protein
MAVVNDKKKAAWQFAQTNHHAANQPMKITGPDVQRVPEGLYSSDFATVLTTGR